MRAQHLGIAVAAVALACSSSPSTNGDDANFPSDPLMTVSSDTGALRVAVRTAPSQPPPRGTITVELDVRDAHGVPQDGLAIDVVPLMPSHGHGASVKPTVVAKTGGVYLVRDVDLFMPGDWELRLTFAGPVSDHAAPKITIP